MSDDNQKPPSGNPKGKTVKATRPRAAKPHPNKGHNFKKKLEKITRDDVRRCYMTWEWKTQEELAERISAEFGEKISPQYISKWAIKHGWEDARKLAATMLQGTGSAQFLDSVQKLKQEASNFDEVECLRGLKARLLKRMGAEIMTNPEPDFFKGLMDVYHSVHKAIADTWEYKLREHNRPAGNDDDPPGGKPPKPEVKENVPASTAVSLAAFKRRP